MEKILSGFPSDALRLLGLNSCKLRVFPEEQMALVVAGETAK